MSNLAKLLESRGWAANLAKVANPAADSGEIRRIHNFRQASDAKTNLPAELEARLHRMAERWEYNSDEFAEVLELAEQDPVKWGLAVSIDERLCERFKAGEQ